MRKLNFSSFGPTTTQVVSALEAAFVWLGSALAIALIVITIWWATT